MSSSTDTTCMINVSVFKAAPYELPWGASVWAKVIAINVYGDSDLSDRGNGAVITS